MWVVRQACQLETDCVAIERVMEYTQTEQEAPWINNDHSINENWPEKGSVKFENYQTRYREGWVSFQGAKALFQLNFFPGNKRILNFLICTDQTHVICILDPY